MEVSRRIRVVYLDHTAVLSGAELALFRLLPSLDVDAHVILGEDGPLAEKLRQSNISVEILSLAEGARGVRRGQVSFGRLPLKSIALTVAYIWKLRRRIRQLEPDLVHTNSLKASIYGSFAARLAGVPVVWHMRDRIADDYLPSAAVGLTRLFMKHLPSAIIANSSATLKTAGDVVRPRVIPSPVIHDVVQETGQSTARSVHTGFRVGMVGRLAEWKGQHVFLRAFARAFRDGDERAVVIGSALFGEDDYERQLHELVVELDIEDRVEFTGFTDNVARELEALDVLVHASITPEPFGQVIVEGMAARLPVIATDQGGPAEIIDNEKTGFLYPPGDVDALAGLLLRLRDDPARRREVGEAAAIAAKSYAPSQIAASVLELYREVLHSR